MLSSKAGKSNKTKSGSNGKVDTLIGHQTEIAGDIRFVGGLHIDGVVKGNVYAEDDSDDALAVVSERGRVEGELRVPNLVINGHVSGDVYATEHIDLAKHARVNGDVYYRTMEMASGGEINGRLVRLDQEPQRFLEHQDPAPGGAPGAASRDAAASGASVDVDAPEKT